MRTQHIPPKSVPSVDQYVAAFRKIEPDITDGQRRMLKNHHDARCHIMTSRELSLSVGYEEQAANIHYGRLGQMLGKALGLDEFYAVEWLAIIVQPGVGENPHHVWVMRENVARAIEELKWADPTSDGFFSFGNQDTALT